MVPVRHSQLSLQGPQPPGLGLRLAVADLGSGRVLKAGMANPGNGGPEFAWILFYNDSLNTATTVRNYLLHKTMTNGM